MVYCFRWASPPRESVVPRDKPSDGSGGCGAALLGRGTQKAGDGHFSLPADLHLRPAMVRQDAARGRCRPLQAPLLPQRVRSAEGVRCARGRSVHGTGRPAPHRSRPALPFSLRVQIPRY